MEHLSNSQRPFYGCCVADTVRVPTAAATEVHGLSLLLARTALAWYFDVATFLRWNDLPQCVELAVSSHDGLMMVSTGISG